MFDVFGGAPSLGLGVLEIWVPTKDQERKRKVPTNSPITATVLLRVSSARPSMPSCSLCFLLVEETLSLPPLDIREENKFIVIATVLCSTVMGTLEHRTTVDRLYDPYTNSQGRLHHVKAPLRQRHPGLWRIGDR
ncbi:hypothetical protein VC83_01069 [Pseudogymnoascus destructans]|uniref:Uncharacterized protein n=1 Tax=Pseudogymnoascus destructans TaxID=655981 RepID=A0A177AM25_9PEZI|nr:uncharacterized protein VC83_01069 [Pseudogymnoascus destructans]OAF62552.1 hypothetical protein VC83_01069 [Pseudogymnoascus destructans]